MTQYIVPVGSPINQEKQTIEAFIDYIEQTLIPNATTAAEVENLQALRQFLYLRLYALEIVHFMNS